MNEVWLSVLLRFLCLYWVSWQPSPFAYIQSGGGRAGLGQDRSLPLVCLASMHLKALSLSLGVREEEEGIKLWQEGVELGKLLMWAGSRVSGGESEQWLQIKRVSQRPAAFAAGKEVVRGGREKRWLSHMEKCSGKNISKP